jgi:hypothetical protein
MTQIEIIATSNETDACLRLCIFLPLHSKSSVPKDDKFTDKEKDAAASKNGCFGIDRYFPQLSATVKEVVPAVDDKENHKMGLASK